MGRVNDFSSLLSGTQTKRLLTYADGFAQVAKDKMPVKPYLLHQQYCHDNEIMNANKIIKSINRLT